MTDPRDASLGPDDPQEPAQENLTVNLTVMNETHDPLPYTVGWTVGQYLQQAGIRVKRNQRLSVNGTLQQLDNVVHAGATIVIAPKIRNG